MAFADDVERKQAEAWADKIVCETCPFASKCDGIEYTPVCLWSSAEGTRNTLLKSFGSGTTPKRKDIGL